MPFLRAIPFVVACGIVIAALAVSLVNRTTELLWAMLSGVGIAVVVLIVMWFRRDHRPRPPE